MTRKVVRSEAAVEDLLAILDDMISLRGIDVALALDGRLDSAVESLNEMTDRGRVVPELRLRGIISYRELVVLPYRIIYRVDVREVFIVAVLDHRRDLDMALYERARRDRQG